MNEENETLIAERDQLKALLAEREEQLRAHEMRENAQSALRARSLPEELMGALRMEDENALSASIDSVERAFRQALETGVRERLRVQPSPAPLEKPARLSYQQAAQMYTSDRAAYDKRFGGKF